MRPVSQPQVGPVVGRFAPTPSGPLHYGSIVAALAGFLDARSARGSWHVRIDDLDAPRARPGAAAEILAALVRLGMHWDGTVVYQSARAAAHIEAVEQLRTAGLLYACACRRRNVAARRYPGTCRQRGLGDGPGHSLRARIPDGVVEFDDRFQGPYRIDAAARIGDVIVRRADGLIAYHLASVTDDHALGATHIVRGADLLDASAVQRCLQRALAFRSTALAHVPMAVDDKGRKLSKSCGAEPALLRARPAALLASVLDFLGQEPGPDLATLPVPDVIDWAISHWSGDRVPRLLTKQPVWPREAGT